MRISGIGSTAALLTAVAAAHGQEPGTITPPLPVKERWSLRFEPTVWYVAPGGKVLLPGGSAGESHVHLETINLDSPRLSPGGELHLTDGRWRLTVGGFWADEDDRGSIATGAGQVGPVFFAAGDRLKASFNLTSVEAEAAYRLDLPDSINGASGKDFAMRLEVLGGIRYYDLSFHFSAPSGSTSEDETQAHPLIGVKMSMDIIEQFTVDIQLDAGGFTYGGDTFTYGYDVRGALTWHPTPNVGVQIGYRDLAFQLRSGPQGDRFEYRGAMQGLYAGAVIRF